jgi:hypothetical protein
MTMTTITEFLEARIAEDETAAGEPYVPGVLDSKITEWETTDRCGLDIPDSRLRAECAAKRAVLTYLFGLAADQERDSETYAQFRSVRWIAEQMAAVYADHPDYQQEWAA